MLAAVGLTPAQGEASAWAITPAGERRSGAGAIAQALDQLLPAGLPLFSALYVLPGLRVLGDRAYHWVARNRHRLPGGPAYLELHQAPPLTPAIRQELMRRTSNREPP